MTDHTPVHAPGVSVRAIVAGHGTFASGIISALDQITGEGRQFVAISNAGLCLDDIQGALATALETTGARVVFTDLPAGSCTMASRRTMRLRDDIVLVSGVNLPLLLDFAMSGDGDPVTAALAAVERARRAMIAHAPNALATAGTPPDASPEPSAAR